MITHHPPAEAVREQVQRIAVSRTFGKAERLSRFLCFVVDKELDGRADDLKEYLIAAEVFGRPDYDPAIDSVVRVEASKLRSRLEKYYETDGRHDGIRIEIPKGGYVPVYHVRPRPDQNIQGTDAPATDPQVARRRLASAVGVAALILLVGAGLWLISGRPEPGPSAAASVAVLPLANLSGDPDQEYFADGMTEALISDLARVQGIRVISRTSVVQYRDSRKSLPEIAQELGVEHVLEGSVLRSGGQVRISAKLIRAKGERNVWADSYERDANDILALQREVARTIGREVRGQLSTPEAERQEAGRPSGAVDQQAYDLYLRGRYYLARRTPDGLKSSRDLFEKAIGRDPSFALAHTGLADAYNLLASYHLMRAREAYPKARASAERALQLDPELAEAHTSLAAILADYYWEWEAAEKSFQRALALSPSYALAHQWYAENLARWGRTEEALEEIRRGQALDPLSLIIHADVGIVYYRARRFEEALAYLRRGAELDPNFPPFLYNLGLSYSALGRNEEALQAFRRLAELAPPGSLDGPSMLAFGHARAGNAAEARRLLDELLARQQRGEILSSMHVAYIYGGLGEPHRACDWLERAYGERSSLIPMLAAEPALDNLRDQPRFAMLLEKMKLPMHK